MCKHAYYMLGALPTLSFTSWRELYHWLYFTSKTKAEETLSNFPNHIQDRDSISDGFKLRSEAMSTSFPCTTLLQSHTLVWSWAGSPLSTFLNWPGKSAGVFFCCFFKKTGCFTIPMCKFLENSCARKQIQGMSACLIDPFR